MAPTPRSPREEWTPAHDDALLGAMVSLLLQNRRLLYATPGLEGVGDHGGERINKKVQAFARRMAGDEIVARQLKALVQARKRPADDVDASPVTHSKEEKPKRTRALPKTPVNGNQPKSGASESEVKIERAPVKRPRKSRRALHLNEAGVLQGNVGGEWCQV